MTRHSPPGGDARFDDTATRKSVEVSAGQAGSVLFDNATDYTLTGGTPTAPALTSVTRFEKRGSGRLFISGFHSFTGDFVIAEGTVETANLKNDVNATTISPLGNPRAERTVLVLTNATLAVNGVGPFGAGSSDSGQSSCSFKFLMKVDGGTLKMTNNLYVALGDCEFNNARIEYGFNSANTDWGLFGFHGMKVKFSGSTPYVFDHPASDTGKKGPVVFSGRDGFTIDVADITHDDAPDVTFKVPLYSNNFRPYFSGFLRKAGAGTLVLGALTDKCASGDWRIDEGTLKGTAGSAHVGQHRGTFGDPSKERLIYVGTNATLHYAAADLMGQIYNEGRYRMHVDHGTIKIDNNCPNSFHNLTLENATLDLGYFEAWPTAAFHGYVCFTGTRPYTLLTANMGSWTFMRPSTEIRVDDITGTAAVDVDWRIQMRDGFSVWGNCANAGGTPALHSGAQKCGWTKTGAGTLFFPEIYDRVHWSSYTGDITIREGTVRVWDRDAITVGREKSALGNLLVERTITVCDTGVLDLDMFDVTGQMATDIRATFCVTNGGRILLRNGKPNALGNLVVCDGTVDYAACADSDRGAFSVAGLWSISSTGREPVVFPWDASKPKQYTTLGFVQNRADADGETRYDITGQTELRIADITGDDAADVVIEPQLRDHRYWTDGVLNGGLKRCRYKVQGARTNCAHYACGILKTGPGAVRLTADMRACTNTDPDGSPYSGDTTITEGAVLVDGQITKSSFTVRSGAFVGGQGAVQDVAIEAGGGFLQSATNTVPLHVTNLSLAGGGTIRIHNPDPTRQIRSVPICAYDNLVGGGTGEWKVYVNGILERRFHVALGGGRMNAAIGGRFVLFR